MTELNERIKASGIKKGYIAQRLNISKQAFSNKIAGKTPFKLEEAIIISHILDMNNDEFFYFFASEVENGRK